MTTGSPKDAARIRHLRVHEAEAGTPEALAMASTRLVCLSAFQPEADDPCARCPILRPCLRLAAGPERWFRDLREDRSADQPARPDYDAGAIRRHLERAAQGVLEAES